ncbi:MAG: PLP-dependent aspartate aminotransferase family protein [Pseudomonadota bacterium]
MTDPKLALDTRLQHIVAEKEVGGRPMAQPVYQTSTYELPNVEIGAQIAAAHHPQTFYTRYGSPNTAHVEALLADLEGSEAAIATGSGMAAVAATILSQISQGDHIVAQKTHYTASLTLFDEWLPRQGVSVTRVEQTDPEAFRAALQTNTRMVYLESPTNPTMTLTDIAAVASIAREAGVLSAIDNTFASSFNQQPHSLGVDLCLHSATKYLNGHSDVTAGVITGSRSLIELVWEYTRVHGPVLHPMEAWLLARGLKTYALRMRQHNRSAQIVAERLESFEGVDAVHYPGLISHPQHELACRQMTGGFSGMLSFQLSGSDSKDQFKRAQSTLERVRLCKSAVSLGSTESLITHPASLIFAHQSLDDIAAAGVDTGLLRLSVGLESPDDILDDLRQAIAV